MIVDFHTHYLAREHFGMSAQTATGRTVGSGVRENGSDLVLEANGFPMGSAISPLDYCDLDKRLELMRATGVDMEVLAPPPYMLFTEIAASEAAKLAREQNESIAAVVKAHPTSFRGLGTVPLQDGSVGASEIADLIDRLGLLGIEIPTQYAGKNLDDPALDPIWQALDVRGALVLIHPNDVLGRERLTSYYLWNLIGNPVETAVALASLAFGGVLDRYPNIRFIAAHGGGVAPLLIGRWDHGALVRPELAHLSASPRELLRKVYVDTIVHDATALRYVIDLFGADHVVLGTDVPFDMGIARPVELFDAILPDDVQDQILSGHDALLSGQQSKRTGA